MAYLRSVNPDRMKIGLDIPILSDVVNAVGNFAKSVPGASWVGDAFNTVTGPVKDTIGVMARDPLGQIVLVAVTNAMATGLAGVALPVGGAAQVTIGPQVASVIWALPGVVQGDSFTDAYAKALTWRVTKAFQILGPVIGQQVAQGIGDEFLLGAKDLLDNPTTRQALEQAKKTFGDLPEQEIDKRLQAQNLDPGAISAQTGAREDAAAAAVNAVFRKPVYDLDRYDLQTGKKVFVAPPPLPANPAQLPPGILNLPAGLGHPAGAPTPQTPPPAPGTTVFLPQRKSTFLGQVFTLIAVTSPAWVPYVWRTQPWRRLRRR
jgi:hypothetical protein